MTQTNTTTAIVLRRPVLEDGAQIHRLIEHSPPLEVNSCYVYMLLCRHFADTCVVAEQEGELVGFVSAYRPPSSPQAIFIWQIAVDEQARGQGLGKRLLRELLSRDVCRSAVWLEATVTPSNRASRRLFQGLARELGSQCVVTPLFSRRLFRDEDHEEEALFRIHLPPSSRISEEER